jgi:hypothetical protein
MSETQQAPSPPPAAPRRRTWLTVMLCVVIFGGGLAVGAGGTVLWVVRNVREAVQHPEQAPHRVAQRLQRRMDLDGATTARVEQALERIEPDMLEARADFLDRMDPLLERIEADVAAELPRDRLDEWHRQFRKFRDDWVPRPERPRRLRDARGPR